MEKAEDVDGFAPGKYVRRKSKAKDIQYLNTRLLYDLIRKIEYTRQANSPT